MQSSSNTSMHTRRMALSRLLATSAAPSEWCDRAEAAAWATHTSARSYVERITDLAGFLRLGLEVLPDPEFAAVADSSALRQGTALQDALERRRADRAARIEAIALASSVSTSPASAAGSSSSGPSERELAMRVRCRACGSDRIGCKEGQTRSADEPMTLFFWCQDCGARWRG